MKIEEFDKPLALFLEWRLTDLPNETKQNLLKCIEQSDNPSHIICILDLIGGFNYSKFKKFLAENPEFEYNSPSDFDMLPEMSVSLNPEQVGAVLHDTSERPLLILAGAGSGKTAVLTRRIVFLLISGVLPESIMAVTFTNKAAGEMKKRLLEIVVRLKANINDPEYLNFIDSIAESVPSMKVGTFHSICYELFTENIDGKYNYEFAGYTAAPDILAPIKQKGILEKVLESHKIKDSTEDILNDISACKNNLMPPELVKDTNGLLCSKQNVFKAYSGYRTQLIKTNQIDFDDIIFYIVMILQKYPKIAGYYHEKYKYFLIDEYQDTNYAQYLFALKIVEASKNIFAVGDDDQSIYGWRGADISNILNFKEDFKNAFVVKFERNYRSSANILMAANNIFKEKDASIRKVLKVSGNYSIGKAGLGDKIISFQAEDEKDEAEFCKYIILETIKQKKDTALENLIKSFQEVNPELYGATNDLLNSYNYLSEYTIQLWSKTVEWVNIYNSASAELNFDKANQLVKTFYEFSNAFSLTVDFKESEKQILETFIERLKDKIFYLFNSSALYRKFAVFYRVNSQKEIFKTVFNENVIPFIEVGNNKLFEFREIQNIISTLKIITGYIRVYSFGDVRNYYHLNNEILNISVLPFFKIPEKDRVSIEYCPENIFLASTEFLESNKNMLSAAGYYFIVNLMKLCDEIYKNHIDKRLNYCLQKIIEYLDYNSKMYQDTPSGKQLKKNIEAFRNIMLEFEAQSSKDKSQTLFDFCKNIVYRSSDQQSMDMFNDGVYLMTLHSAKGLEFENVFFTGLEEDVCPHKWPSLNKIGDKELDEEKRLFYVGITRAQEKLYLTYAKTRTWYGKKAKHKPSRFLKHIPSDLIQK
ncbi:MAG TPA: UvrD-helicase domain-containing protein [bacterium]|nr:UvrD-helicase domain-containing protein [bacterium]HPN29693.1 UvrD-helicase domain-containing protein [bacterium]